MKKPECTNSTWGFLNIYLTKQDWEFNKNGRREEMSRIGNKPITVPAAVEVKIDGKINSLNYSEKQDRKTNGNLLGKIFK